MAQLINKIAVLLLIVGGFFVAGGFIAFVIAALAILAPGIFLYYLSIKLGIQQIRNNLNSQQAGGDGAEYDENGFKVIGESSSDAASASGNFAGNSGDNIFSKTLKSSARWVRDKCDKYLN